MSDQNERAQARILVVDDEPEIEVLFQQRYRRQIADRSYAMAFALNGNSALDILVKDPALDIVLTDINMPHMNGITLLEKILSLNRPTLRTVIISAYDDMDNIRAAMNRGAFDFLTKPINFRDLDVTLEKTKQQVRQAREAEHLRGELQRLLETRNQQQKQFSRMLIETQEEERKRIAADLHDSLGQMMLVIRNRALLSLQQTELSAEVRRTLDEIAEAAGRSLEEVRHISHNLRPYQLDRFGLSDALKAAIETVSSSSAIHFRTQIEDLNCCLKQGDDINLYRIIQEVLNNILKHSQASEATIAINRISDKVHILIEDNGIGLPDSNHAKRAVDSGFGLNGVHERVHLLEGEMFISSGTPTGTRISITIPCTYND